MSHKIFLWSLAILGSVCTLFITLVAASPNAANLAAMIGLNTGADCENPSAIGTLKELARRKLGSTDGIKYLLPRSVRTDLSLPTGTTATSAEVEYLYQRKMQEILTSMDILLSSHAGTIVLTPLAIRDRGSLANGRACAAFIRVASPSSGSGPALVFEIAASYKFERTRDDQIVVSASFSPK